MNLQTKKIIAREFILLLVCFAIAILTFFGLYLYNSFNESKIKSISSQIQIDRKVVDSLEKTIFVKLDEYGIPIRKMETRRMVQLDSNIQEMLKNGASNDDVERYASDFRLKFGSDSFKERDSNYLPTPPKKKVLTILSTKRKQIIELQNQLSQRDSRIIYFHEQKNISFISFLISLIGVFFLRYLFYGIRWSTRILNEK